MPTSSPAESARAAAAAAARAADAYEQAKELDAIAQSIEDDAARLAATGDRLDAQSAEQFREEAGVVRAAAAEHTRHAEQSEQIAREELERTAPPGADAFADPAPLIDSSEPMSDFAAEETIPTDTGTEPAFEYEG